MKKILGLADWKLDKKIPNTKRIVHIDIHLKYANVKKFINDIPSDRVLKINQDQLIKFTKLIKTGLFETYQIIGTGKKPRGIKTKIPFSTLIKIEKLTCVETVFISQISHAKKVVSKPIDNFYCVKMIVAIEIEGRSKGLQTIEERFVIVKANSFENAYKKIDSKKEVYADPYINSAGQLVRWKIEKLEDCYLTPIEALGDLNKPEGVEVFSKLKTRRLTKQRVWNGKTQ